MKSTQWRKRIEDNCRAVGTYREAFAPVVQTLADILERRDETYTAFLRQGAKAMIEKVSDRGAVNLVRNPMLQLWADLNTQALTYWRNLGLTPAGLKKLGEDASKPKDGPLANIEKAIAEFERSRS